MNLNHMYKYNIYVLEKYAHKLWDNTDKTQFTDLLLLSKYDDQASFYKALCKEAAFQVGCSKYTMSNFNETDNSIEMKTDSGKFLINFSKVTLDSATDKSENKISHKISNVSDISFSRDQRVYLSGTMKYIQINLDVADGAKCPENANSGDSGFDVFAFLKEDVILKPGDWSLVPTGLKVDIPYGFELQVRSRSGLAFKQGVFVLNSPGTVDSCYRGDIGVIMYNLGKKDFTIHNGDKIAQLVPMEIPHTTFIITNDLSKTERGDGGFGSTGI